MTPVDPRFAGSALDELRKVGDEPADRIATALLTAFDDGSDETEVVARAFRVVARGDASTDDDVLAWLRDGPPLPAWVDHDLVAAGQRFFCTWPMPIATTLFCAALPTTYAAPDGAAVMMATSQMSRQSQVARRLAETGRMIFDVMSADPAGTLLPGRQGYVSARGVRLLHAVVRQALLRSEAAPWPERHGVPINQEDQLGTLMAFTVTVLDGLRRLGVPVSDAEAEAYVHAWCVVGALLGIDESLLPLTPDRARSLADAIADRQLKPSSAGRALTRELLQEMRLAMPTGFQRLPAALMHHLVPDIADLLHVPRTGFVWSRVVDRACAMASAGHAVPRVRSWAGGAGAVAGRAVLQMYIDREQQPGGPSYRLDAAVLGVTGGGGWLRAEMRTDRRRRRGDVVGVGPHVGPTGERAAAALPDGVTLPVDVADVQAIASEGYPLWEPVDVMVRRNRCITLAYADLSARLADLTSGAPARAGVDADVEAVEAGAAPPRDANWCTFATWSSKTIGTFIEDIPPPGPMPPGSGSGSPVARPGPVPGTSGPPIDPRLARLVRRAMLRGNGAAFRTLAAGNRVVFLEIGLSIARFLDAFPTRESAAGADGEARWTAFWAAIDEQLEQFALLDPSWMLTAAPPPADLRGGLRQYFEALREDDPHRRSQRILAGNLLLGAYEQRRVDGYVSAALALFTEGAMRRLICDRTGALPDARRWPSRLYALLMTRRMSLLLPGGEVLLVGRPVTPPPRREDWWRELATDADVTLPELQALITRYQLAVGRRPNRGARNWTSFDQRMRTIGNLFRLRHRQPTLFSPPFPDDAT